jgi:hypothetical protein
MTKKKSTSTATTRSIRTQQIIFGVIGVIIIITMVLSMTMK